MANVRIAIINEDLVTGVMEGAVNGIKIPDEFSSLPYNQLRFTEGKIVDGKQFKIFYMDSVGRKHILPAEGLQRIECDYDDLVLMNDKGEWKVITEADFLERNKARQRNLIEGSAAEYVNSRYPELARFSFLTTLATTKNAKKKERIKEVFDWINGVAVYKEALLEMVDVRTAKEDISGVVPTLSQFDATDPKVTITEITS